MTDMLYKQVNTKLAHVNRNKGSPNVNDFKWLYWQLDTQNIAHPWPGKHKDVINALMKTYVVIP